ncbi:hypothetical protein QTP88_018338 [Uroleucon formosanum]
MKPPSLYLHIDELSKKSWQILETYYEVLNTIFFQQPQLVKSILELGSVIWTPSQSGLIDKFDELQSRLEYIANRVGLLSLAKLVGSILMQCFCTS